MARPRGISTGRERLIEAAGRTFRTGGYGGAGIDAVAKEAGLTSGAFYAHFGSKANAFRAALTDGLDVLLAAVRAIQAERGADWVPHFIDFYLGERLAVDLSQACALPTLSADAARADAETREAYQQTLGGVVEALATGMSGPDAPARAWALLSILAGAATMARAVADAETQHAIVEAARAAARSI